MAIDKNQDETKVIPKSRSASFRYIRSLEEKAKQRYSQATRDYALGRRLNAQLNISESLALYKEAYSLGESIGASESHTLGRVRKALENAEGMADVIDPVSEKPEPTDPEELDVVRSRLMQGFGFA